MRQVLAIRTVVLLAVLLACVGAARAQFDARFNQYWGVEGYYHPAWAGKTNELRIQGAYSLQLMGFTHAPGSMYAGADVPFTLFGQKHGAGAGFFNESIGLFSNQRFWLQYAYQLKLGKGHLGIGVQVGMLNSGFDPTDLELPEEDNDEAFPATAESGMGLDLGAGLYYSHPKFFVALSGHHLTSPQLMLGDESYLNVKPALYFTGGYNIKTRNPLLSIQPLCHVQTDLTSYRVDLTGRVLYTFRSRVLSGALTYSPGTSVGASIGLKVGSLNFGYAYEMYTSAIGAESGTHELMVGYSLDLSKFKKSRNLHKSIRIL